MDKQEIFEALENLVQLKKWKDQYGKDLHYVKAQPKAWEIAFKIVEREQANLQQPTEQLQQADVINSVCGCCHKKTLWIHYPETLENKCMYCETPRPQTDL